MYEKNVCFCSIFLFYSLLSFTSVESQILFSVPNSSFMEWADVHIYSVIQLISQLVNQEVSPVRLVPFLEFVRPKADSEKRASVGG